MSTTTIIYPNVFRVGRSLAIQLIKILIIISLAMIASAILVKVTSAPRDSFQTVPVVQNSIMPISVPVPAPPTAYLQPIPSKMPAPASMVANEPSVIPVPVPTPPSFMH